MKPLSGKYIDVINPTTEAVMAKVANGAAADVDMAVQAATRCFNNPAWRQSTGSYLHTFFDCHSIDDACCEYVCVSVWLTACLSV